jgi:uncharacterized protein (TIGR02391 family)
MVSTQSDKETIMPPQEFKNWRSHLRLTQRDAADLLGISVGTIELYERGTRRDDGRPVVVPKHIELACSALTLALAAERNDVVFLTPDVRAQARHVMYLLSLPTFEASGTAGKGKSYPTRHASLRDKGFIPENEPSLLEQLFPLADPRKLRGLMYEPAAGGDPKALLHPSIANRVRAAFMRGDLDQAVFISFKAVEEAVRQAGGYNPTDIGTDLMRKAFDSEKGKLTDLSQPKAEREALSHLFAGAIGSYKNPHSHRTVNLTDPREAQEQVMLATHLLNIVDTRRPKLFKSVEVNIHPIQRP